MNTIPLRLKREPLLEAVWEIRFSGAKPSVADLMPGMVFKALSGKYGNLVRSPVADIPAPIVQHDPGLQYLPTIRLEDGNQAVQIGGRLVSLSCRRPYTGWLRFSADIRELAGVVRDTGLVNTLERFSLRYIDLLEATRPPGLACLNLEFRLGEHEIVSKPVQLRTEIAEQDITHIVQIASPAEVTIPGGAERLKGVVLDIDSSVALGGDAAWEELERRLDAVHDACKRMFFSLLKPETIAGLEPEYER
jgi:uncharacterized protein (TIGR04255 family)